jgi:hypothetical protein
MLNVAVFIGEPLLFKNRLKIFPPKVREVVTNPLYNTFLHILTISQEDIRDELKNKLQKGEKAPTPLEFLLNNCFHDEGFKTITEKAFEFIVHEPVHFLYENKKLVIGEIYDDLVIEKTEDLTIITEDNFFDFQNAIREVCGERL